MPASAAGVAFKAEEKAEAEAGGGELLYCGTTRFDLMGRELKGGLHRRGNLVSPTRLRPLMGVDIRFVATGCAACHCVALGADGRCFTWGQNEKGQLGHGDTLLRDLPTVVSELSKYNIIKASVGRNHTVIVTDDGKSFAFGDNKHGQLGTGSLRKGAEVSPAPCLVTEATNAVCGADFTVWLSSVEGSSILTAGSPKYGQLGHGSYNEHNNSNVSSVMLSNHPQPCPRAIATLSGKSVVKVACGTNHTVAVDSSGFVYTWGFGGYGRLGHYEPKDEWQPRLVQIFQKNNVLGPNDIISAGSASSACTAGGRGQLYMWGQVNYGNAWMYPVDSHTHTHSSFVDLDSSGWNIRCMASGSMHHAVGADDSCLSWGPTQRSSVNPEKVEILEEMHVTSVGCGVEMSLIVVDRANVGNKIDQLNIFYGDSDALFEEKGLFVPPRRYNNEEQKTNTSQQHATHKTAEGTPEQKATHTTNSWPNKRKTTVNHPESEVKDEVEGNNGPSTRSGRGRPKRETESPPERAPLTSGSSGRDYRSNQDAQKKNRFLVKSEDKYVQEE